MIACCKICLLYNRHICISVNDQNRIRKLGKFFVIIKVYRPFSPISRLFILLKFFFVKLPFEKKERMCILSEILQRVVAAFSTNITSQYLSRQSVRFVLLFATTSGDTTSQLLTALTSRRICRYAFHPFYFRCSRYTW